jgi:hypothetical protein
MAAKEGEASVRCKETNVNIYNKIDEVDNSNNLHPAPTDFRSCLYSSLTLSIRLFLLHFVSTFVVAAVVHRTCPLFDCMYQET